MGATQAPYGDVEPDDPIEQLAFTHSAEGNIMHNRHPPLTTTTTGHDGSVRLELDKQGVGRRMREGIDDKAFPEQGAKVSIHSDGSFEGLGCVLANTNLNVLTAVFYWFTLKRDEPFYWPEIVLLSEDYLACLKEHHVLGNLEFCVQRHRTESVDDAAGDPAAPLAPDG